MNGSVETVSMCDPWIGRVIEGRYRVQARLAIGGMGVVYRVEHLQMGRIAAMKVLHRELARQPGSIRHFKREVELVSRLDHPHIVQTFDCGTHDGQLYLVMEYVPGEDLASLVHREGPLAPDRALALAIQICSALEEAHEQGVLHCDLKPDNVVAFRRREVEEVKVLDFGLAKLREACEPGEVTQSLMLGGTPQYMSPEQVLFERVDPRTDVYSLGATLYRLVTAQPPFAGGSPIEIMRRHLLDELVPPSRRMPALALPAEIDAVVMRAMARRRDDRYGSAREMRDDLQAAFNQITGLGARGGESEDSTVQEVSGAQVWGDSPAWLERDEFELYERHLRRRRHLGTSLVAAAVVSVLALMVWAAPRFAGRAPPVAEARVDQRVLPLADRVEAPAMVARRPEAEGARRAPRQAAPRGAIARQPRGQTMALAPRRSEPDDGLRERLLHLGLEPRALVSAEAVKPPPEESPAPAPAAVVDQSAEPPAQSADDPAVPGPAAVDLAPAPGQP